MKIQAHRGASKERPENTMAAFRRAVDLQADGIELDVHKVRDGALIVSHDASMLRCMGEEKNIYDLTGEQIRAYSAGKKFSPRYEAERAPYLTEVLELVRETSLFLNIEIKAEHLLTGIELDVMQLLRRYDMQKRSIISSYRHDILREIKRCDSGFRVGALYDDMRGTDPVQYAVFYEFDAIHPYFPTVEETLVSRCHAQGIQVNPFTVDRPEDIRHMMQIGVDSVITNDVAIAKRVLQK